MSEFTTKKFDWSQPIHNHVTGMAHSYKVEVNENGGE